MRDVVKEMLVYITAHNGTTFFREQEAKLGRMSLRLCMVQTISWLKQRAVSKSNDKMKLDPSRYVIDGKILQWLKEDPRASEVFVLDNDTLDLGLSPDERTEILLHVDKNYHVVART